MPVVHGSRVRRPTRETDLRRDTWVLAPSAGVHQWTHTDAAASARPRARCAFEIHHSLPMVATQHVPYCLIFVCVVCCGRTVPPRVFKSGDVCTGAAELPFRYRHDMSGRIRTIHVQSFRPATGGVLDGEEQ